MKSRDDWMDGAGETSCAPGRRLFVVAIDSRGQETERNLRQACWDYFGSLCAGVRELDTSLSTDQVIGS